MTSWHFSIATMRNFSWFVIYIATFGCTLGCGDGRPQRVPVSGRVLIDGEPVVHGNIRVFPENARAASGQLGADGRFELTTYDKGDGCVLGTHVVTVNALEPINANSQRWHAPRKYREVGTSGLTLEVTEATDTVEILLTWDGGKPFVERSGDAGGD